MPPPPPPPSDAAAGTDFRDRFALETGRIDLATPADGEFLPEIHGEYQLRASALSDLPLQAMASDPSTGTLGSTSRLEHWLRITPRLSYGKNLSLIGQIDVPRGFIAGGTTRFVSDARDPYAEHDGFSVAPRWLYLQWQTPIGLVRLGQQPSHWGMGILANDGDHPSLFGDYRGGAIAERFLFATRPFGKDSYFDVAIAGDVVFQDATARLTDDDHALQGVLALRLDDHRGDSVGLYGVVRHQTRDASPAGLESFDEELDVVGLDSSGRFDTKIPGSNGHVFGEYEVAYLFGDTDFTRTVTQTKADEREKIEQIGAAARVGAVLLAGTGEERWGRLVPSLEWGWASGDADPNDGTTRRFRFDPNHSVGLLLFREVMAWKTARAAAVARDPALTARPAPGVDLLPSNGAVFGATYLYPTFVYRPLRELDLKAGAVFAQATADVVDPVRLATTGRYVNYDGGSAKSRDLGVELDLGVEYRYQPCRCLTVQIGAQAGVLFPGGAFKDGAGSSLGTQSIAVGRLGLQY